MRTTIDLEAPVLEELKRLQRREGVSLGALASRLLADAMTAQRHAVPAMPEFRWKSHSMDALVDLGDKDAVFRALDRG
jgi:hypothetical protein